MFLEEPSAYRALVFSCKGLRGWSKQASPCDAWRLVYISMCPRARVPQEGFCGSASGGLHPAAACTKDLEDSKGGPGSQAQEGGYTVQQRHNSDQAKKCSLRLFSIFIVGEKSL